MGTRGGLNDRFQGGAKAAVRDWQRQAPSRAAAAEASPHIGGCDRPGLGLNFRMAVCRVLVIGGYGFFGRRLVARLSLRGDLQVLVAGRRLDAARSLVQALGPRSRAQLSAAELDVQAPTLADDLRKLAPTMVIDTAGPFQGQPYRVPRACIASGVHCVDLADDRAYVCGITDLDAAARQAGVAVVSGASSVPALSGAAADHLAGGLASVTSIDIGISPGNRTERGHATVAAILRGCGQPMPGGDGQRVGWLGSWSHAYPDPVGRRLLSPCDVPDLALLPARHAGAPAVRFGAGLEIGLLHRAMNLMAWCTRRGLVRDWSRHAGPLKAVADWLRHAGTDAGAMHVSLRGLDAQGSLVQRRWQLIATDGDGPHVPTLAAAALVDPLRCGQIAPGARPCLGLLTLDDFQAQCDGLAIRMAVSA